MGTPKSELRKWAAQIGETQDWHTVREDVEAKRCAGPDGTETFVLIRSVERREKERAMHQRFSERIEAGLTRLAHRLAQARAGLGHSPRTILDEAARIQSTDVVLPTTDGREVGLRCVVRPDLAQARLLDRLGLVLPERLRIRSPLPPIGEM